MKRNALLEFAELTIATSGSTSTAWMYVGKRQQGSNKGIPKLLGITSVAPTGTDGTSAITVKLEFAATDGGSPTASQYANAGTGYPAATAVAGYQICAMPVLNFADEYARVTVVWSGTFSAGGKMKFAFVPDTCTAI